MKRSAAVLALLPAVLLVAASGLTLRAGAAEPTPPAPHEIDLREGLVLPPVGLHGRLPLPVDVLLAQLVNGSWKAPHAGDALSLPDGSVRRWEALRAKEDGSFNQPVLPGGYAYFAVPSEEERVMLLEAAGNNMVYINGEPRVGDLYQNGYVRLPILLHKGTNDFLFQGGRGSLRAKLVESGAAVVFNTADTTLPDLLTGSEVKTEAAVVVLNASTRPQTGLVLKAEGSGAAQVSSRTSLPVLPPLSLRKVAFSLAGPAPTAEGKCAVELTLIRQVEGHDEKLDTASVELRVLRPEQTHRRTFRSSIDGSVQYYALVPARQPEGKESGEGGAHRPGLILTLHGASVEAIGQAGCFTPKPWAHVVAPTNRRPFGFDWEDWGRLDALEVLEHAQRDLDSDPQRTYLTGHSMGGHGTWHLGVTFPDRFAAVGPSAGWISFWTYGMRRPENSSPLQELMLRCTNTSDTLALMHNCAADGVYVLHGDRDDNVPVDQARAMRQQLGSFHPDFCYHEQPGAGHWWGNPCVDWPPMMTFFTEHTLPSPDKVLQVDFHTASPGVSAWCHWAGIETQLEQGKFSSVSLHADADARRINGSTTNVARLALDLTPLKVGDMVHAELDGQKLDVPWPEQGRRIWLQRQEGKWKATAAPAASLKGPQRYGPFKDAFRNRMVFVYGTKGTAEENAWAFARARFDAETFWYRGNGSVDVVADTTFEAGAEPDRNVILYGHAEGNAAWKTLLADSPVQVQRGVVQVGDRKIAGDDLGCLFLRPRPGSDRAVVGVVAGSGLAGLRLTESLPYFVSGVGYPDCLVLGPETLSRGGAGVRVAGFFGEDWGVGSGEFVWGEER